MKLSTITEDAAEYKKLLKNARLQAREEFEGLVDDPDDIVRLAQEGILKPYLILQDDAWWRRMFSVWFRIPEKHLQMIFQEQVDLVQDIMNNEEYSEMLEEGVIGGFFKTIFMLAALIIGSAMGGMFKGSHGMRGMGGRARGGRRGKDEAPKTDDLVPSTAKKEKERERFIKRLNTLIIVKFLRKCRKHAKKLIESGKYYRHEQDPVTAEVSADPDNIKNYEHERTQTKQRTPEEEADIDALTAAIFPD